MIIKTLEELEKIARDTISKQIANFPNGTEEVFIEIEGSADVSPASCILSFKDYDSIDELIDAMYEFRRDNACDYVRDYVRDYIDDDEDEIDDDTLDEAWAEAEMDSGEISISVIGADGYLAGFIQIARLDFTGDIVTIDEN